MTKHTTTDAGELNAPTGPVATVQAHLGVKVTGKIDGRTRDALRVFQARRGITRTGDLDPTTLHHLALEGVRP